MKPRKKADIANKPNADVNLGAFDKVWSVLLKLGLPDALQATRTEFTLLRL